MNQNSNSPVLVGLGEILWDQLPAGRQLGGAPANFAYHVRAMGGGSAIISAVGDDDPGREILHCLDRLGLNRTFVVTDSRHPTGTVSVRIDSQGVPTYTIRENTAWDFITFHPGMAALADTVDVVCFGSLCQRSPGSRGTIHRFLRATRPGCKRIFDINLRQSFYSRQLIEESLRISNILKLNDNELKVLAEMFGLVGNTSNQISQLLRIYPLELIALTRGPRGAVLYTRSASSECGGFPASVVDTVGAGDAYTAALALGLLAGASLDDINRRACCLAAFVCSQQGATPRIPAELAAKLF